MRYTLFIFALISIITCRNNAFAQVGVGANYSFADGAEEFAQEDLDALKKTKTAFVYGDNDTSELNNWKKVLASVWTITPVEFVHIDGLQKYIDEPGYSIMCIKFLDRKTTFTTTTITKHSNGITTNRTTSSDMEAINPFLELWIVKQDKKGKRFKQNFLRIELFTTFPTASYFKANNPDGIDFGYIRGEYYNYYPGLLKPALKTANDLLAQGMRRDLYKADFVNGDAMRKLRTDTLYIPEYALMKVAKLTGDESRRQDPKELMADYPYPYRFVSAKTLSDKIVAGEPFTYMIYTRSSTDTYVSIYNAKGDWIYTKYDAGRYQLKPSDFEDLSSVIKK